MSLVAEKQNQEFHANCLMCGSKNPMSLGLKFSLDGNGITIASFQPNAGLQGYDRILHGGVICSLLDSVMTHCLFQNGIKAVTGDLKIKFLQSVSCFKALALSAFIEKDMNPLYIVKSKLTQNDELMAWAEAKFMKIPG